MPGNSYGQNFRITTFGESHGSAMGVVIDGCPAGLVIDESQIEIDLQRRRPGQSHISTQRKEKEEYEILSGVFEGKTLGTPIAIIIKNSDARSTDYDHLKNTFRPSHADFTYQEKYGIRDHRGGGRASARETVARVLAGAIAKMLLKENGIQLQAFVTSVGSIEWNPEWGKINLPLPEDNIVRCPDEKTAKNMIQAIEDIRKEGDTLGGSISCIAQGLPAGLGEPVFDKLEADLAKGIMSINAVKGFEIGSGFSGAKMKGSEHNDLFEESNEKVVTSTNHSGGIQGGISNGMDIYFKIAFKPVATIMQDQKSVTDKGATTEVKGKGRHDPCVVPRAVPIVEAMTAITLADHILRNRSSKL